MNLLALSLDVVVVDLLLQLHLEPLQGPVLVQQFVSEPGDLSLSLAPDPVQRGLQGVDASRQVHLLKTMTMAL